MTIVRVRLSEDTGEQTRRPQVAGMSGSALRNEDRHARRDERIGAIMITDGDIEIHRRPRVETGMNPRVAEEMDPSWTGSPQSLDSRDFQSTDSEDMERPGEWAVTASQHS